MDSTNDEDAVPTLTNLAVRTTVTNLLSICKEIPAEAVFNDIPEQTLANMTVLSFPEGFLPPIVADRLVLAVIDQLQSKTKDPNLENFAKSLSPFADSSKCRITKFHFSHPGSDQRTFQLFVKPACPSLKYVLDKILRSHDLVDLSLQRGLGFSDSLSFRDVSFRCLRSLNFRDFNLSIIDREVADCLKVASQLRCLDLSGTGILSDLVNELVTSLVRLEVLELARCSFHAGDLCLEPVAGTLRCLNLQMIQGLRNVQVLKCLRHLQHIDVSGTHKTERDVCSSLIDTLIALPAIISIDLSQTSITQSDLQRLVTEKGDKLNFLGLYGTLDKQTLESLPSHITIASHANFEQLTVTFCNPRYFQLALLMADALRTLYSFLKEGGDFQNDLPQLMQTVMKVSNMHVSNYSLQLAGSACLIVLFKILNERDLHAWDHLIVNVLRHMICLLKRPRQFLEHQLHMNIYVFFIQFSNLLSARRELLPELAETLCSAIKSYSQSDHESELRIRALSALRSLTYNADSEGRTVFGQMGVVTLLKNFVSLKADSEKNDTELCHVLSAIWSLTDENVSNCLSFAEGSFVDDMLKLFQVCDSNAMQLKIHGGLGNLLEMPQCRIALMRDDYCKAFVEILREDSPDVGYPFKFDAAHAMINLAMLGEDEWRLESISYREALNLVVERMKQWPIPTNLGCCYRTFTSHLTLINESDEPSVHLYALWTICNFCFYDSQRYVEMLVRDGVVPAVKKFLPASDVSRENVNSERPWNLVNLAVKLGRLLWQSDMDLES